uniref:Uncharacterized protein n=1 Tax=Dulem virus 35 TaxID=3145753 RepID=A0AAU8AYW9_9CAUD
MQNYEQILQELGVEVPEDKKADLKKKMGENYRTIADYNKVVEKRDEYKTSLDDVQTKLDGFKDVDVSDLKNQIATLTTQLADEKAGRQADALKIERTGVMDEFLKDKKFVNPITEKAIRESILAELEKNTGKSVEKIFDSLTKDKDGNPIANILVDEQQERLEAEKARFTQPTKPTTGSTGPMTKKDIMDIKDASARQKAISEHLDLFGQE